MIQTTELSSLILTILRDIQPNNRWEVHIPIDKAVIRCVRFSKHFWPQYFDIQMEDLTYTTSRKYVISKEVINSLRPLIDKKLRAGLKEIHPDYVDRFDDLIMEEDHDKD